MSRLILELDVFEDKLFENFEKFFLTKIDFEYWLTKNKLSPNDLNGLTNTVDEAFANMERIGGDVDNCKKFIKGAVFAGLNVPFVSLDHIDFVLENVHQLYFDMFYFEMCGILVKANHGARVIQRRWRWKREDPRAYSFWD